MSAMGRGQGLDPLIERQFGWARGVLAEELMVKPELIERLMASYDPEGGYRAPEIDHEDVSVHDSDEGLVAVRVYGARPGRRPERVLVWSHGGGFAGGDLEAREADGVAREVVARSGAVVVSVGYRLARPGHHYPHLHREVRAAYRWVIDPRGLGADPDRVVVGGASAGASLSLSALLELRDAGERLPGGLLLAYPLLFRSAPAESLPADIELVPEVLRITQPSVDGLYGLYEGTDPVASTYAVADGHNLAGLPESLVIVAEYDDLRGHGERFAVEAAGAGVAVSTLVAPGVPHGHLQLAPTLAQTDRSLDDLSAFVSAR